MCRHKCDSIKAQLFLVMVTATYLVTFFAVARFGTEGDVVAVMVFILLEILSRTCKARANCVTGVS